MAWGMGALLSVFEGGLDSYSDIHGSSPHKDPFLARPDPQVLPTPHPASPDPAEICRPSLAGRGSNRWNGLDPWPHADRALADLSALNPKDPLHRVLVEAKKPGNRSVTERRFLLDHCLDRHGKAQGVGHLAVTLFGFRSGVTRTSQGGSDSISSAVLPSRALDSHDRACVPNTDEIGTQALYCMVERGNWRALDPLPLVA